MSFTDTSTEIRFDTTTGILMGLCEDWNKKKWFSYVETNRCLGNGNGKSPFLPLYSGVPQPNIPTGWFKWGEDSWMGTSRNIHYTAYPPTIHAEMQAWDKQWYSREVRLDDGIENHNGVLRYDSGGIGQWVQDLYDEQLPDCVKRFITANKMLIED